MGMVYQLLVHIQYHWPLDSVGSLAQQFVYGRFDHVVADRTNNLERACLRIIGKSHEEISGSSRERTFRCNGYLNRGIFVIPTSALDLSEL